MTTLKLSEDGTHYIKGPKKYTRLTHLLGSHGIGQCKYWTERGRDVGTNGHKCCHLLGEGVLDWDSVDAAVEPRVRGYEKFLIEYRVRPIVMEGMYSDDSLGVATTIDLLATISGTSTVCLFEIKFGSQLKSHRLQTGLQSVLLNRNGIYPTRHFGLYLKANDYRLVEHVDYADIEKAKILVSAHHIKIEFGGDQDDYREQTGISIEGISGLNATTDTGPCCARDSLKGQYCNNQD